MKRAFLNHVRVLFQIVKMSAMERMMYKAGFFLHLIGYGIVQLGSFFFIDVIFRVGSITSLGGWNQGEVLMLVAVMYMLSHMGNSFFGGIFILAENILSGNLDMYLIKPVNTRISTHFFNFNIWQFLGFVPSFLFLYYNFTHFEYQITGTRFILALLLFFFSTVLFYSLYLMLVSAGFWTDKIDNIFRIVDSFWEFGQYPMNVFPRSFQHFLTFIIPIFPLAYFPTSILLGKGGWIVILQSVLITAVFITLSSYIWRKGLRNYSSASS